MMYYIVFYAVSAIFSPYNGGQLPKTFLVKNLNNHKNDKQHVCIRKKNILSEVVIEPTRYH